MRRFSFAATDTPACFSTRYAQASAVLAELGLGEGDHARPLFELVADDGELLARLAGTCRMEPAGDDGSDWSQLGLSELIDHILATHHPYLWAELGRFEVLIGQVAGGSGLATRVGQWCDDLRAHMVHEEDELFPLCRRLEGDHRESAPDPETSLHGMYRGHTDASSELRIIGEGLAALADDHPLAAWTRQTFSDLVVDLHQHVELEDGVLLPAVLFNQELRTSRRFRKSQVLRSVEPHADSFGG